MWLLGKMLSSLIRKGRLVVTDYDGRQYSFGEPDASPLQIRLTDKRADFEAEGHGSSVVRTARSVLVE